MRQSTEFKDEEYTLATELVINTINKQYQIVSKLISISKKLTLDLSEVKKIDSAGIAFLVTIKNLACKKKCNLAFININQQINNLCQLYKINIE